MGPEMEVGERSEMKMEASTSMANGNFTEEYQHKLMKHTTNYEDCKADVHLVEQTGKAHIHADLEINILKCTNSTQNELVKSECQDTAECSSSFDDIDSGVENMSTLSEYEVLSNFHGDTASALDSDGFGEIYQIKKKKMTTHWQSFIQPPIWRCKWAELQIKKLQSQAQKYDRKLEEYSLGKQVQLENSELEGLGVKSIPFPCKSSTYEILRRKRRRRAEAAMDIAAYMSQHNFFSYYENKKYFANCGFMGAELKDPVPQKSNINDEFWVTNKRLCLETGDTDNSVERILLKIDFLQSQVTKMEDRANKGEDDVLIDNQMVKEETNNFEEVKNQQIHRSLVLKKDGLGSYTPPLVAEPDPPPDELPPPKIHSTLKLTAPKNKRKRGNRKEAGRLAF